MRANVRRLLAEDVPAVAEHRRPRGGEIKGGGTTFSESERNTADYITARLKRDDPELAEKVVAGEITPNTELLQHAEHGRARARRKSCYRCC